MVREERAEATVKGDKGCHDRDHYLGLSCGRGSLNGNAEIWKIRVLLPSPDSLLSLNHLKRESTVENEEDLRVSTVVLGHGGQEKRSSDSTGS